MASSGSVGGEQVPEDKPGTENPAAAGISATERQTEKVPGSDGLLFVLAVHAASRLFYLVAGALFAGYLPAGGFHWLTPDVPHGRLNIWAHWDGAWYSQIAAEG